MAKPTATTSSTSRLTLLQTFTLILGILTILTFTLPQWKKFTITTKIHNQLHPDTQPIQSSNPQKKPTPKTHNNTNPIMPRPIIDIINLTRRTPQNTSLANLDFHVPAILTVHAIRDDDYSKNHVIQLTLFVQGAESYRHQFYMNVTGCIIGDRVVAVKKRLINLFVCRVNFELKRGDRISLVLGVPVFKKVGRGLRGKYREWVGVGSRVVDGRRVVRSEQIWGVNVGLDLRGGSGKVWEVCGMYQDKNSEIEEVLDWVEYHRRVGVDRFFIYDNYEKDDVLGRGLRRRDDVEVVFWPWRKSQEIAQNHFLVVAKTRCKWVLMCDVDEYVLVRPHGKSLKTVLDFVERKKKYGGISMASLTMSSSGHVHRPNGSVPEVYLHRQKEGDWHQRKPLVLARDVIPRTLVHYLPLRDGRHMFRTRSHPERVFPMEKYVFVVHYTSKSWEDYFKKSQIGRSALEVRDWGFGKQERNYFHKKYEKMRKRHISMKNQVVYKEFLKVWKNVMKQKPGKPIKVVMPNDTCVTCWYRSRVRYEKRR